MARTYARIFTAVWRDREFRRLRGAAQRVFLLLVSQPDITAAGTLALTVRRWADMDSDTTIEAFNSSLDELAAERFLALDRSTEELLVRSFVRWDGGYSNTKRRPVILRQADDVSSPALRRVLAAEFGRLGLPIGSLSDAVPDSPPDAVSDRASDAPSHPSADLTAKPTSWQVDSPSDTASDAPSRFDGLVVTEVDTRDTGNREPQTPIPPSAARDGSDDGNEGAQALLGEWLDRCAKRPPGRVVGQVAVQVKAMLAEGVDPDDIRRGLSAWMTKGLHPSTLPSVVNEVMNRAPPTSTARPSTTDQRTAAVQALKTQFRDHPTNQRQLPAGGEP